MNQHHLVSFRQWLWLLLLGCAIFIQGCAASNQPMYERSLVGNLRGGNILVVSFRVADDKYALIEVNKNKSATQSSIPSPGPRAFATVVLPDLLYSDIDQLRSTWCQKTPVYQIDDAPSSYSFAIDCNRVIQPTITVPPDEMPKAIQKLIRFVPQPPSL
jgi:hypothetical protein